MGFRILTAPTFGTGEGDWVVLDGKHICFRGTVFQCCMWVVVEGPLYRVRNPF